MNGISESKFNKFRGFLKKSKITISLMAQIVTGIVIVAISLTGIFKITHLILKNEILTFDVVIRDYVYLFRGPIITELMRGVTFLGSAPFLGTATIATTLFLLKNRKKDALVFTFILSFGVFLNIALKYLFQRPRPDFLPLANESSYSLPSGHSMNSFVFYTCISFFIFRKLKNKSLKIFLIGTSILLIFFVGISRIYLGVHYPSDVLAGFLTGLLWFVLVLIFEKTILFFKLLSVYEGKK